MFYYNHFDLVWFYVILYVYLFLLDRPMLPHSMLIIGWWCSNPE